MARPKTIDDETLLDSARETFLELGPSVSTQELARRAGVSEGTLFRRFGDKVRLFGAAMALPDIEDNAWFQDMLERAGHGDLEAHLRELALGMVGHINAVLPAMQTVHRYGGLTASQIREMCGEGEPAALKSMARFREFFAREVELGRIRAANPDTLADFFVGSVAHRCHVHLYFRDYLAEDEPAFASRLARDFVELMCPR